MLAAMLVWWYVVLWIPAVGIPAVFAIFDGWQAALVAAGVESILLGPYYLLRWRRMRRPVTGE